MGSNVTRLSLLTRRANKRMAAEFLDVNLKTLDSWIRQGAPVVKRGGLGRAWELDLLEICRWRFSPGNVAVDDEPPEQMAPHDRKAWYESEVRRRDLQERDRHLLKATDIDEVLALSFSVLSRDLRALPDFLERRHGVPGEVAHLVGGDVSEALDAAADRLESLTSLDRVLQAGD